MTSDTPQEYEHVQSAAFAELVKDGTYDLDFEHSDYLKTFFDQVMAAVLPRLAEGRISVLDAGCGTGAWLYHLVREGLPRHGREADIFGFDLTPAMAEVAARHLQAPAPGRRIKQGSIMDDNAYTFAGGPDRFDLVFAFDVVQQLPPKMQFDACLRLIRHTAPHGYCVIFDHDWHSPYGYKMAVRKFATRRLGIPLVPRYYCNAQYPPLRRFKDRINTRRLGEADIMMAPDGKKRALVVRMSEGEGA